MKLTIQPRTFPNYGGQCRENQTATVTQDGVTLQVRVFTGDAPVDAIASAMSAVGVEVEVLPNVEVRI